MAHELEIKNGEASFIYAGQMPWHRVGQKFDSRLSPSEALIAAKADYSVEATPVLTPQGKTVPGVRAISRTDSGEPLAIVRGRYTILNNRDAFVPLFEEIGGDAAIIETCGVLKAGREAFMMARVPETIEVKPGDVVLPYLLAHTSHTGEATFSVTFSLCRAVCANTVNAAFRGSRQVVKLKHTRTIEGRAKLVLDLLGAGADYRRRFREAAQAMTRADVNREKVIAYLSTVFPDKIDANGKLVSQANTRGMVLNIFDNEPTTRLAGSNAWGLYQAVTHHVDHVRGLKGKTDRWAASVFGSGVPIRQRAWDASLAMVN